MKVIEARFIHDIKGYEYRARYAQCKSQNVQHRIAAIFQKISDGDGKEVAKHGGIFMTKIAI
jgi:hypothetical protein